MNKEMFQKIKAASSKPQDSPNWVKRLPSGTGLMGSQYSPMPGYDGGGLMTDFNILARQLAGFKPPMNSPVAPQAPMAGQMDPFTMLRLRLMQPGFLQQNPQQMTANIGTRG